MSSINPEVESDVVADCKAGAFKHVEAVLTVSDDESKISQWPPEDCMGHYIIIWLILQDADGHGCRLSTSARMQAKSCPFFWRRRTPGVL